MTNNSASLESRRCERCGAPFTKNKNVESKRFARQRYCSSACGGAASNQSLVKTPEEMRQTLLERSQIAENTADRDGKGRQARGERAGRARLTEDDVRAIRISRDTHAHLAERYGVVATTIQAIRSRRTWRHV